MTIPSFRQHNLHPTIASALPNDLDIRTLQYFIVHCNSVSAEIHLFWRQNSIDLHMVRFCDMRFRRRDAVGPFCIIRKKKKSFARLVQSPNGEYFWQFLSLKTFENRFAAFFIRCRSDQPPWFVEHQINALRSLDALALNGDPVAPQVNSLVRIRNNNTVYPNCAFRNEPLRLRS